MSATASLIIGGLGLASGIGGGIFGHRQSKKAEERQKELLRQQRRSNEAWYARNYFQDYLNSVEAQNAIRRTKEAWGDRMKEARARQAVSGGTPEQMNKMQEIGARAMGNTIADVAAQGSAIKRDIDRQKQQMDNEVLAQEGQIAAAQHEAAQNLVSNAISTGVAGLQIGAVNTTPPANSSANSSAPTTTATPASSAPVGGTMQDKVNPAATPAWYDYPYLNIKKNYGMV